MKTSSTPKSNTELPTSSRKNLIIAGNDKGGCGKSTTTGAVVDGMKMLGYKLRLADGDASNQTFQHIFPGEVEKVDFRHENNLDAFIASVADGDEDLTVLDLPGESGFVLTSYFKAGKFEIFEQLGIRVIVGLTLHGGKESIIGARKWAATFRNNAEFIGLANGMKTPSEAKFSLAAVPGGQVIAKLIQQDRMIIVPRFSETMVQQYAQVLAPPSAFLPGGRAYQALGFNILNCWAWRSHHSAVVAAVAPHAEWLTGKPMLNPVDASIVAASNEDAELDEYLKAFDAEMEQGKPSA